MARDWRDDRIEELERQLEERDAQIRILLKRLAELEEKVKELSRSSRDSGMPPSSDGPEARAERPKKTPSGRKPGGQPGHKGHQRTLVPPEKVAVRMVHKPQDCGHCGGKLVGDDAAPLRHQVAELPKVEPIVTEHELHALTCTACGHTTRAELPAGVPSGAFGPSVWATVALMLGPFRMTRRVVAEAMRDLFGLEMSVGAVVNCQERASEALREPVEEAKRAIQDAPVKNADETSWRIRGKSGFLWTVVTATLTVFMIHARRTEDAARALLGVVYGTIGTDRHGAYNFWPTVMRQFCWAHLIRGFRKIADRGGDSKVLGERLIALAQQMFGWWHRVRDGTLARSTFRRYMKPMQDDVWTLLSDAMACSASGKTRRTCAKLIKSFDSLWTFLYRHGVEPTNNAAERAVRHAVMLRKLCYGSHSECGALFTERILTCHATLRQQGRHVLPFLTQACSAWLNRSARPSLLAPMAPIPASTAPQAQPGA